MSNIEPLNNWLELFTFLMAEKFKLPFQLTYDVSSFTELCTALNCRNLTIITENGNEWINLSFVSFPCALWYLQHKLVLYFTACVRLTHQNDKHTSQCCSNNNISHVKNMLTFFITPSKTYMYTFGSLKMLKTWNFTLWKERNKTQGGRHLDGKREKF